MQHVILNTVQKRPAPSDAVSNATQPPKRLKAAHSDAIADVKCKWESDVLMDDITSSVTSDKPATRGVERVGYPLACRPSEPLHAWYRGQLVKEVNDRLAAIGKRTIGLPRFLGDGVTFDWIFDKSLNSPMGQSVRLSREADESQSPLIAGEKNDKENDFVIPGFIYSNAPNSNLQTGCLGTADNPIAILDSDDLPHIALEDLGSPNSVPADDRDVSRSHNLPESMSLPNTLEPYLPRSEVVRQFPHGEPKNIRRVSGGESSLRGVDWENYKSILFVKRLYEETTVEDIYKFLNENGFPFSSVSNVLIHRGPGKPMVSFQFNTQEEAEEAFVRLERSRIPFPEPSEGSSRHKRREILVEQCQMPLWYRSNAPPSRGDSSGSSRTFAFSPLPDAPLSRPLATTTARPQEPFRKGEHGINIARQSSSETETDTTETGSDSESDKHEERKPRQQSHSHKQDEGPDVEPSGDDDCLESPSNSGSSNSGSSVDSSESDSDSERDSNLVTRPAGESDRLSRTKSTTIAGRTKCTDVSIPKVPLGRPRRLLVPSREKVPLVTISMRSDVQFVDRCSKRHIPAMSLPAKENEYRHVVDACLVRDAGVIGYKGGDHQVSILTFKKSGKPVHILPLPKKPHSDQGISCLAPFSKLPSESEPNSISFFSGGYDKTIKFWRILREARNGSLRFSASIESIPLELNSHVTALSWRSVKNAVLGASGMKLWTIDIERGSAMRKTSNFSNLIHQIHSHPENPHLVIMEFAHLYSQVQVFDVRKSFEGKPAMEFGYTESSASSTGVRLRQRKGDTTAKFFCRGFNDGTVALWDYRNPKVTVNTHQCREPVCHTVFENSESTNIWAFAGNVVSYLEVNPTNRLSM